MTDSTQQRRSRSSWAVKQEGQSKILDPEERAEFVTRHPHWHLAEDGKAIRRDFKFADFPAAWAFMSRWRCWRRSTTTTPTGATSTTGSASRSPPMTPAAVTKRDVKLAEAIERDCRMTSSFPERSPAVRLATGRLCLALGWSALHEVTLPNGRRADVLALRADGGFVCIEVKSGVRDFVTDTKWPQYLEFADALCFAVDADFPAGILPEEAGFIVACDGVADMLRPPPESKLSPARRRALLHRFAQLAADRLALLTDPAGCAALRSALRAE